MLNKRPTLKDLESIDPEFYNSIVWIKWVPSVALCWERRGLWVGGRRVERPSFWVPLSWDPVLGSRPPVSPCVPRTLRVSNRAGLREDPSKAHTFPVGLLCPQREQPGGVRPRAVLHPGHGDPGQSDNPRAEGRWREHPSDRGEQGRVHHVSLKR